MALSETQEYLAELPCQVVLRHGDLLQAIESTDKIWDVLFTGFALHHLMPQEKRRFFYAVGRCLSQDGWLILVDVVREENQGREDYLDCYLRLMREKWTKVPQEQLEEACMHVRDHDYPESLSTLKEMAKAVGLSSSCVVSRYAQHYTLLFSRYDLKET